MHNEHHSHKSTTVSNLKHIMTSTPFPMDNLLKAFQIKPHISYNLSPKISYQLFSKDESMFLYSHTIITNPNKLNLER